MKHLMHIFTLIIVLTLACKQTSIIDGKPFEDNANFVFEVREGYNDLQSVGEPSIYLYLKSERMYGSSNYSIEYYLFKTKNTFFIYLFGVSIGLIHDDSEGPARVEIPLNVSEGESFFQFYSQDRKDIYSISIDKKSISVRPIINEFTKPEYSMFWRYPQKSFAYICGTYTDNTWIHDQFLNIILQNYDLEEYKFPKTGKICYQTKSSGHYVDFPAKYFVYWKEEDYDEIGNELISYSQSVLSQQQGVGISLTNWRNKRYLSWLYDNN